MFVVSYWVEYLVQQRLLRPNDLMLRWLTSTSMIIYDQVWCQCQWAFQHAVFQIASGVLAPS